MSIAIVQFGGSNCDLDVLHVLKDVVGVDAELVWYKEEDLDRFDGIVIPGGFSYGDYLRAGAIAARTPVMNSVKPSANRMVVSYKFELARLLNMERRCKLSWIIVFLHHLLSFSKILFCRG